MVTMAQSAANWRNTHTQWIARIHSYGLHQHSYNHVVRSASSAIQRQNLESNFYFEGTLNSLTGQDCLRRISTLIIIIIIINQMIMTGWLVAG